MATKTFHPVNNDKAGDAINWTPNGAPAPGDTLILPSGPMYLGSEGGDLAGDTLTLGVANATNSVVIDMQPGAVLATGTADNAATTATMNVQGRATATLGEGPSGSSTAHYVVNLQAASTLIGTYALAYNSSITVNAPAGGAEFENDATSFGGGIHAVIDADVIGTGSFQVGTASDLAGVLEFGGSVAATETIDLVGALSRYAGNVSLVIDKPQDFHAPVNLNDGTINLKGLAADAYSLNGDTITLYRAGTAVDTIQVHDTTAQYATPAAIIPLSLFQSGADVLIEAGASPVAGAVVLPVYQPPLPPGHVAAVLIHDTTTNADVPDTLSQPYPGNVAGISTQFIDLSPDNLNITATVPNVFIHSGSGNDAINVAGSGAGGINVLDGGTGSNFLVGGTGSDTFFADDRSPTADIWSTIVNFHSGAAATIFGVTATGFAFDWENNQGAVGATGLTLHATAPGKPIASVTLAGFSTGDLTNGRLNAAFGTEADGTSYLYIKAT